VGSVLEPLRFGTVEHSACASDAVNAARAEAIASTLRAIEKTVRAVRLGLRSCSPRAPPRPC
jgi:hypothetical protein